MRKGRLFIKWIVAMMEALDEHRPFTMVDTTIQLKLDL